MTGTWVTDLTHFVDDDRGIAPISGPGQGLAEYFAAILAIGKIFQQIILGHPV